MPRRFPRAVLLAVAVLAMLVAPLVAAGATTTPAVRAAASAVEAGLYADVLPDLRAEVTAATADDIDAYEITATLDSATGTIAGEERVAFVNRTAAALEEVWFRLFPNADYYGDGGLAVDALRVGSTEIAAELAVAETALRVALPEPVVPGATVEIALAFTTTVPADSIGSFGILNRDSVDGTWILADWYPIVAGYEEGTGWDLDPPTEFGDPTFAESALYDVVLTVPSELRVVTSGSQVEEAPAGHGAVRRRYVAGPARDFTLVADDDYVAVSAEADGTTVTSYAEPEAAAAGQRALAVAVRALEVYGDRFGAYPFAELDLVQTRLEGALGVAWAGLLFLDGPELYGIVAGERPELFESVVAHEVGHQWWGGTVGTNTNDHAFMVEGLTNYLAITYLEWTAGEEAAARQLEGQVARVSHRLLAEYGDTVADAPTEAGQNPTQRAAALYGKAALGFLAIRREIGDDAFFAALRAYAEDFAFEVTEPADLRAAFETAAGRALDELWRHWFEAAELTAEEIDATLATS